MNRPHSPVAEISATTARIAAVQTPRLPYETPRAVPLGEWTVLTLAGSAPISLSLPLFGK